MMITLEAIEAEHAKVSEMIATFKQQALTTKYAVPAAIITLAPGEHYAGIVLDGKGDPAHHLILLAGDNDGLSWADAKSWAAQRGGELPKRCEHSLLFANLKNEFRNAWYWCAEEYEENRAYAWFQGFGGSQGYDHKGAGYCFSRAIRRVIIE
jgi:hypothetical protein